MTLPAGERLGAYELVGPLGAGGMGEVYRARDTRLGRDVAIKTLPDAFAQDPDRLARFEREARTLAALNHPNIAGIHGLEEWSGGRALVMELVEGVDLSERLAAGRLPLEEAIAIARQIADALEAAHEAGIIHRDLKPANIKVKPDGTVKVLDFGLAKALAPEGADTTAVGGTPANSPTLTARATEMGLILGTAAYMSPEQARGKRVDRRADVWAFGVVLFEMLTGRRAFDGPEVTDVLAAVIKDTLPLETLPADTPPPMRRLLRRCLEKDPARRLDSMRAARLEIDDALRGEGGDDRPIGAAAAGSGTPAWRRPPVLALAAVVLVVSSSAVTWWLTPAAPAEPVTRMTVTAEPDSRFVISGLAVSPDAGAIVYPMRGEGGTRLYLRRRNDLRATPIPGTDGAEGPFFSPNGEWVGFFTSRSLKKVNLSGGEPVTLCDVGFRRGATWTDDGRIVFASGGAPGLMVVSDAGGQPVALTSPAEGEEHYWPSALPDNHGILYTSSTGNAFTDKHVAVASPSGESRRLVPGTTPVFLPPGYLVFGRESSLWAVRFDPGSLRTTTEPVPVLQDVQINPGGGWGQFALSAAGTLAFLPGATAFYQPVLLDGTARTPIATEAHTFDEFRVSPDGRSLVVEAEGDTWVLDIERGVFTRITTSGSSDPIWAPDGSITAVTAAGIMRFSTDGSGEPTAVLQRTGVLWLGSWSPDGKALAFESQSDIWIWSEETGARAWFEGEGRQGKPEFSPNGRWVAYVSDDTGEANVYVRPFPGPGGARRVSPSVGREPAWARDGRTLYYRQNQGLMSVSFDPESGPTSGRPTFVFSGADHFISVTGVNRYYDLMPNGRGIIVLELPASRADLRVVFGWRAELASIVNR